MYIEVIHNSKSIASESYRTLRSNIQFSNFGKNLKIIVITSANPNEGKSEVSINLTAALAQQGKKVILIDADMRKPTQHKLIDKRNNTGLSKLILGEISEDAVSHLNVNDVEFDVLTSGPVPPNPSEILVSSTMEDILNSCIDNYDYIIVDTPPLLAATDAPIMANVADATLLVVDMQISKRKQIIEAKKRLNNVGARFLGVVANKLELHENSYYHYNYK